MRTPYRVEKNALGSGEEPPMEVAEQMKVISQHLKPAPAGKEEEDKGVPAAFAINVDRMPRMNQPDIFRKLIPVKLTHAEAKLVIDFPAWEVDVQEKCINVRVQPEFSLNTLNGEKMEFEMQVHDEKFNVVFLGLTIKFKDVQAITFIRR